MKKEEAIKYLQQLYPNGGHCWLDEQRIEAIGMAIQALQEEPVSDDFEMALAEMIDKAQTSVVEPRVIAAQWKDELIKLAKSEEPVSDDLKTELNKYIKDHFTIDKEQLDRFGIDEKDYMYSMDVSDMLALVEHFTNWQKEKEESTTDDLEEACEQLSENARKHKAETSSPFFSPTDYKQGVIDGARWQKNHLWKPANGDDLPEIDREVIALLDNGKVVFAHRPNPNGWDGKSITTGNIEHYTPKTYDKGGWNIPNVKYWLDCLMPKEIEL